MAYKRKVYRRKKYTRKPYKPVVYRKLAVAKRALNAYSFKRTFQYVEHSYTGTGGPYFDHSTFQLADIPSYAEFSSLFDRYRLNAVKVTFIIGVNIAYNGSGQNYLPRLHSVIDYDDNTNASSLDDLMQYQSYKLKQFTASKMKISRYIRPKTAGLMYKTGVTSGYSVTKPPWIDLTTGDVPHYGLKWAFEIGGAFGSDPPTGTKISEYRTYYFQVKDVR